MESEESEKLLVIPLSEDSGRIATALANERAREILSLLSKMPLSAKQISERLGVPLNTVTYNLENLLDAGLIRIEHRRWSRKGREVKVYAPARKLIVLVPENLSREQVLSALKKYLVLLFALFLPAMALEYLSMEKDVESMRAMREMVSTEQGAGEVVSAKSTLLQSLPEHAGILFFLGGLFVLVMMLLFERKMQRGRL